MVVSAIQSLNWWWRVDQTGGMLLDGTQEKISVASVEGCAKILYETSSFQAAITDWQYHALN